ncbi:MAG: hypothetical protein KGN79_12720, partial [Acidobacteriota bacterium]|nr:hypothetical protein [Acidobacteriota bacterium]
MTIGMLARKFAALVVCAGMAFSCALALYGQTKGRHAPKQAKLSLKAVVASTEEDGRPAALRITLKNVGAVSAYVPPKLASCAPD